MKNQYSFDNRCTDKPVIFRVETAPGDYRITALLGDPREECRVTIKAESRRLIARDIITRAGEMKEVSFTVNCRRPYLNDGTRLLLNDREAPFNNWDNFLNLEFNGPRISVHSITIEKEIPVSTIYLMGDSTVTDQEGEPWAAWGQMLPSFFKPGVSIANYAESGESLKSFEKSLRWAKVEESFRSGDYLFMQFGHNDQKSGEFFSSPYEDYKQILLRFSRSALNKGVQPVIIGSMHRRKFDEKGNIINTLDQYPEAAESAAADLGIPFINLTEISRIFYEALGPEKSKKAFVHVPGGIYPGLPDSVSDDTHFRPYGAYQLALGIISEIQERMPALTEHLRNRIQFDPALPEDPETWYWPETPNHA